MYESLYPRHKTTIYSGLLEPQNARSFQKDTLCGSYNMSQVSLSNMAKKSSLKLPYLLQGRPLL